MPMGRPTDYNEEITLKICTQLAQGRSMRSICTDDDMPAQSTVYEWLERYTDFAERYTRARERQAHTLGDIAVDMTREGGVKEPQADAVRLNALKWAASKIAPKFYGDKLDLNHGGQGKDNPQRMVISWDDE
jgi:hypothetical protein